MAWGFDANVTYEELVGYGVRPPPSGQAWAGATGANAGANGAAGTGGAGGTGGAPKGGGGGDGGEGSSYTPFTPPSLAAKLGLLGFTPSQIAAIFRLYTCLIRNCRHQIG